ncbi:DUF2202 domain-containing protein [Mangrovibacterium lignilyticum]|uniref:DUF2202 domain-containing protein n=1 Tax=Mangrovibacterium lignilyticum TaxID=2668052 RepID=UPI0013D06405|nr:DUF2202 domain-containing protein [Mangrovibacterium lignilyticum]
MKTKVTGILLGVLLSVTISGFAGVGNESLPDEVKAGLLHMREEEKLAHDLYTAFGDLYDLRIFGNIPSAEANHMAAMLSLLEAFGLEDPASADDGVFNNEALQTAYDKLLSDGTVSLVAALKSGAYVEELDILDLEEQLELTTDESIALVYSNLLRGSRNHLRAFNRVLANNGVDYQPQLMSQESFDEIVNDDMERGGGKGQGCCRGRGCRSNN